MRPSLEVGGSDSSGTCLPLSLGAVGDFSVPDVPTVSAFDSFRFPCAVPADFGGEVYGGGVAGRPRVMRNSPRRHATVSSARRWLLCGRPVALPPNLAFNRTRVLRVSFGTLGTCRLTWFR